MAGLVIVGAGECGMRSAFAAREAGYDGSITVIGDETGMPYERPPLSKPGDAGDIEKPITTRQALQEKRIDLLTGSSVARIDRGERSVSLEDGTRLSYQKLLLATGARPRKLACPGGDNARIFRTLADAKAIYKAIGPESRVLIIGAGLIGLELASVLVGRCASVVVVEAGPRPLGRNVPEVLAERLGERHRQNGVDIRCGRSIAQCTPTGVQLDDGPMLLADLMVAAIGVEPDTRLASAAGLATDDGILVDLMLRTADPDVFAAGDCARVRHADGSCRRYETWQNAQVQGEIAGKNMAGLDEPLCEPAWFWSDQYDLGLQGVGDTSGTAASIRTLDDRTDVLFFLGEDQRMIGAAGLGPGNAVARDIKVAQRLIAAGTRIDANLLGDPQQSLKKLLKAA